MQRTLKPVLEYSFQRPLLAIETLVLQLIDLKVDSRSDESIARCTGLGSPGFLEAIRYRLHSIGAVWHDGSGLLLTELGQRMLAERHHPVESKRRPLERYRRVRNPIPHETMELEPEEVRELLREDDFQLRGRITRGSLRLS
jgi:hypothetical protein